jgi:hypothetical protein
MRLSEELKKKYAPKVTEMAATAQVGTMGGAAGGATMEDNTGSGTKTLQQFNQERQRLEQHKKLLAAKSAELSRAVANAQALDGARQQLLQRKAAELRASNDLRSGAEPEKQAAQDAQRHLDVATTEAETKMIKLRCLETEMQNLTSLQHTQAECLTAAENTVSALLPHSTHSVTVPSSPTEETKTCCPRQQQDTSPPQLPAPATSSTFARLMNDMRIDVKHREDEDASGDGWAHHENECDPECTCGWCTMREPLY